MATISKKFKVKLSDGTFSEDIAFSVDSVNVEFSDGKNLDAKITEINETLSEAISTQLNPLSTKVTKLETDVDNIDTLLNGNGGIADTIEDLETVIIPQIERVADANASNIEDIQGEITTIKGNIQTNTIDISALRDRISASESDIQTNVNNILLNKQSINANSQEISTIKTDIASINSVLGEAISLADEINGEEI